MGECDPEGFEICSGGFSRPVPAVRGAVEVSVLKGNHEKIEIFLTAYFSPSAVAPSGLSDERTDEVVREEFSRVNSRRGKIYC